MIATMTSARERIGKRDIAIATVLSALGLLLMYDNVWGSLAPEERVNNPDAQARIHVGNLVPYELAVPLFLLVTVPLLWRRVSPLAAVQASFAGLVVNDLLIGTEALRCGVILPTAFLLAFAAGSRLDARDARIALAFAVALVSLDLVVGFPVEMAIVASGLTAAIWGIGRVVQSRGRMAAELEARTADLRQARDERARMEVASARARLSRELDELLQRRLGELARMAEDGSRPDTAGSATAALAEIETTSRRTLEEMRSLVGLLRDDSSDAPTAPQPTLTHLEALLVRAKGADARLTVEGNPRVLPAGVELAAYRIVEHLLAAVDDSSDVNVRVRFADDALELAISGPARRDAKASFERARERVRMQSGTFEATTRRGRSEAVVSLPVLSAV